MEDKKPEVTKFDQKIIDAYEKFIIDVYETCRFVAMGSGIKEIESILIPLINAHEKEMWHKISEHLDDKSE